MAGRLLAASVLVGGLAASFPSAAEDDEEAPPPAELTSAEICGVIGTEAGARTLPSGFLARLIWQESRFDRLAVSPKGAQGIAQFMPGTARERALADPFDIRTAVAASAALLADHATAFGNLGLAAAAYNAGPERVRRWLAGQSGLPLETRRYVHIITGRSAESWREPPAEAPDFALHAELPFEKACVAMASTRRAPRPGGSEGAPVQPWGAQVAAHFSSDVALATFQRLQRRHGRVLGGLEPSVVRQRAAGRGRRSLAAVRIGADSRASAQAICNDLKSAGAPCVVMKN